MIELGEHVADKITGFSGVATGRCVYLTSCTQILIVPKIDKDGKLQDGGWIDEQRVEVVSGTDAVCINNGDTPGADISPPRLI